MMDVISVIPQPGFQLLLTFANGELRQFDMRPLLAMKPWSRIAAPALFAKAHVDYGTVVWPGEIDIAPETLLLDSVPAPNALAA
jgi:Protein of unknown function (DUF2442)